MRRSAGEAGRDDKTEGEESVMAGIAAAVVGAAIEALEADRSVWAAQAQEIGRIIGASRQAQQVDWTSPASGAFHDAMTVWVRDAYDLMALADEVVAAIAAHVEALRDAAEALTAAESALSDPVTWPFLGLPNPVPFGGVL